MGFRCKPIFILFGSDENLLPLCTLPEMSALVRRCFKVPWTLSMTSAEIEAGLQMYREQIEQEWIWHPHSGT